MALRDEDMLSMSARSNVASLKGLHPPLLVAIQKIGAMVLVTMRTLPAVWVMAGITMLVFGIAPGYVAVASWLALAMFLLLELGWELRQFGQWTFDLSPFAYVHWSITNLGASSVLGLTLTAAILVTAGLLALGHRDIG